MIRTKPSGKRKPDGETLDNGARYLDAGSRYSDRDDLSPGLLDLGDVSADLAELAELDSDDLDGVCSDLGIIDGGAESAQECDYDSVSSPGGSTCSGPTYIRHMGFGPDHSPAGPGRPLSQLSTDSLPSPSQRSCSTGPPSPLMHSLSQPTMRTKGVMSRHTRLPAPGGTSYTSNGSGHPITGRIEEEREDGAGGASGAKKKKKKILLRPNLSENTLDIRGVKLANGNKQLISQMDSKTVKQLGTLTSKNKSKKEPLPMKLRALPQSFWQQPNHANPLPPGSVYSTLPPLPGQETDLLDSHVPPLADVAGDQAEEMLRERSSCMSSANTDLLFSLFNGIENEGEKKKIQLVRRGRPKKAAPNRMGAGVMMAADDDPCMVSTVTESILPLIPERGLGGSSSGQGKNQGTQIIKIMSISHGDRSVDLPSLNVEHNYPHLLSELVMKL